MNDEGKFPFVYKKRCVDAHTRDWGNGGGGISSGPVKVLTVIATESRVVWSIVGVYQRGSVLFKAERRPASLRFRTDRGWLGTNGHHSAVARWCQIHQQILRRNMVSVSFLLWRIPGR